MVLLTTNWEELPPIYGQLNQTLRFTHPMTNWGVHMVRSHYNGTAIYTDPLQRPIFFLMQNLFAYYHPQIKETPISINFLNASNPPLDGRGTFDRCEQLQFGSNHELLIVTVPDDYTACIQKITEKYPNTHDMLLSSVLTYRRSIKISAFRNLYGHKFTLIIKRDAETASQTLLQLMAIMPRIFFPDIELDPDFITFLNCFVFDSAITSHSKLQQTTDWVTTFMAKTGLQDQLLEKNLNDFLTLAQRRNMATAENNLRHQMEVYNHSVNSMLSAAKSVALYKNQVYAYSQIEPPEHKSLLHMFKQPNILSVSFNEPILEIAITNPLDVYDPYCIAQYSRNPYFKSLKLLFNESSTYQIYTTAFIMLNLNTFEVQSGHYGKNYDIYNYPPHPHINLYGCFGANARVISDALQNEEYEIALAQIFNSTRNFNLEDTTVTSEYLERWHEDYNKHKCILNTQDGRWWSLQELIDVELT